MCSYHGLQTEFLLSPKPVFLLLVLRDRLYTTWLPAAETPLLCKAMSRFLSLVQSRMERALQGRWEILENKCCLFKFLIVWYNEYELYLCKYLNQTCFNLNGFYFNHPFGHQSINQSINHYLQSIINSHNNGHCNFTFTNHIVIRLIKI